MKQISIFLVLLACFYQVCAEEQVTFTFGFEEKELCVVEGEEFEFCIVARFGESPVDFNISVTRTYEQGSATGSTLLNILTGFNESSDPICETVESVDNDCLDDGNSIDLEIEIVGVGLPTSIAIAEECGSAEVEVFDDDIVRFWFAESPIYASEDDSEVNVCVNLTWVEGPTKRAVPIFFYAEPVEGVVELQKKIVLIPKGSENEDMICCPFELSDDLDVASGETESFTVHVRTEDVNVLGPGVPYVEVIVHDVVEDICRPEFTNNSPMVTGTNLFVQLSECVTSARCRVGPNPDDEEQCAGPDGINLLNMRNTRQTLSVFIDSPVVALPMMIGRQVTRDNDRCDSHLLNNGFDVDGTDAVMMFEGTGPMEANPNTNFMCTVVSQTPSGEETMAATACNSFPNNFEFTIPEDTSSFCVTVRAITGIDGCRLRPNRVFCYPLLL